MKRLAFLVLAALPCGTASADGFVMGAGRWTCEQVLAVAARAEGSEFEQLAGWVMGFWSHATFERETGFVDIVENVGGRGIFEATLGECQRAPGETQLYVVSRSMIENTK